MSARKTLEDYDISLVSIIDNRTLFMRKVELQCMTQIFAFQNVPAILPFWICVVEEVKEDNSNDYYVRFTDFRESLEEAGPFNNEDFTARMTRFCETLRL